MKQSDFSKDNDRGMYRAIVVDSDDPLNLGRVKVRIPTLHGGESEIADKDLPWGYLCSSSASHNAGSYLVPEKGSSVWTVFENGDRDRPVVMGGCYGRGREEHDKYRETDETYVNNEGRVIPARHNNIPIEALYDKSARVVYKSAKGHVLVFYDGDGAEAVELSDANGQTLMMRSPLRKGTGKMRGVAPKRSLKGESVLNLTNSLGQALQFMSDGIKNVVHLIDEVFKRGVIFDEEERVRIVDHKDEGNKTEIDLEPGVIKLRTPWATVEVNNLERKVKVEAITVEITSQEMKLKSNNISVEGDIGVKGNISATGSIVGVLSQGPRGERPESVEIEEKEIEDWGITGGL